MADFQQGWKRFLPQSHSNGFRSEFAVAFAGQTVCVAGAGGYIGSALVKALGAEGLRAIVLLDSSEHALFELQRYMEAAYPAAPCQYILGSVDDAGLLAAVFSRFRPQIVFHAAAFKHVGLLEHSPFAAIQNNSLGTYTLVRAALAHGISKLVLVSTDKAVNSHSVMGVSKRIAELITLSLSSPACQANAIRLGNVIGSTGSVIPIFLEQIANGRPISVTHPQASRYFLSREEAVTGILAAGGADCEGMVLLPALADPVLVTDLADFLLKTHDRSGTTPLCFTGLRPGEKLTEDLVGANETPAGTIGGPLTVVRTERLSRAECEEAATQLSSCIARRDPGSLLQSLCQLVPEYVPSKLMRESAAFVS